MTHVGLADGTLDARSVPFTSPSAAKLPIRQGPITNSWLAFCYDGQRWRGPWQPIIAGGVGNWDPLVEGQDSHHWSFFCGLVGRLKVCGISELKLHSVAEFPLRFRGAVGHGVATKIFLFGEILGHCCRMCCQRETGTSQSHFNHTFFSRSIYEWLRKFDHLPQHHAACIWPRFVHAFAAAFLVLAWRHRLWFFVFCSSFCVGGGLCLEVCTFVSAWFLKTKHTHVKSAEIFGHRHMFVYQVSAQHLASGQLVAGGSEMLGGISCTTFNRFRLVERLKGCVLVDFIYDFLVVHKPLHCFCIKCCQNCGCQMFKMVVTLLHFHSRKTTKRYLDKRRPIQKRFVGFKDLCADWTSCKAGQLVIVSYCFVLFLHDLTSKVMPWQLLLLGMFPIIKAGCGPCRGNLDFSWVCSKPAHPHSFRSCTPFACTCRLSRRKTCFSILFTHYIVT